jgi:flagellar hook-basal body complex protein FliE
MAIESIGGVLGGVSGAAAPATHAAGAGPRFSQAISRLLEQAESGTAEANTRVRNMLSGTGDVHEAMIALQRAELSLQLTVQVRNKLMNAYQEIMRMPV